MICRGSLIVRAVSSNVKFTGLSDMNLKLKVLFPGGRGKNKELPLFWPILLREVDRHSLHKLSFFFILKNV